MIYYKSTPDAIIPLTDDRLKPLSEQCLPGDVLFTSLIIDMREQKGMLKWDGSKLIETEWDNLALPHTPLFETISHINMFSGSRTSLGKALSNFANTFGQIQINGETITYHSIEGLWQYLKTSNKSILVMDGYMAKCESKRHPVKYACDKSEFDAIIFEAMYNKINNSAELLEAVLKNKLPIVHYYTFPNRRHFIKRKNDCQGLTILKSVISTLRKQHV